MANKKKVNGFTQIPNWYWELGLTLVEVNIIARIASWQREGKEFYESAEKLSILFGVSYSTVKRSLKGLVTSGIIRKNGKHKRMWKYVINELKLETVHREQYLKRNSSHRPVIQSTVNHYNTNKTSTKTSFREEDDFLESSPSKGPSALTELDIIKLAQSS